jgi:hypothetical protein
MGPGPPASRFPTLNANNAFRNGAPMAVRGMDYPYAGGVGARAARSEMRLDKGKWQR